MLFGNLNECIQTNSKKFKFFNAKWCGILKLLMLEKSIISEVLQIVWRFCLKKISDSLNPSMHREHALVKNKILSSKKRNSNLTKNVVFQVNYIFFLKKYKIQTWHFAPPMCVCFRYEFFVIFSQIHDS